VIGRESLDRIVTLILISRFPNHGRASTVCDESLLLQHRGRFLRLGP
jgi:hypothetical protein